LDGDVPASGFLKIGHFTRNRMAIKHSHPFALSIPQGEWSVFSHTFKV